MKPIQWTLALLLAQSDIMIVGIENTMPVMLRKCADTPWMIHIIPHEIHSKNINQGNIITKEIITTGITGMDSIVVTIGDISHTIVLTKGDLTLIIGITLVVNIYL